MHTKDLIKLFMVTFCVAFALGDDLRGQQVGTFTGSYTLDSLNIFDRVNGTFTNSFSAQNDSSFEAVANLDGIRETSLSVVGNASRQIGSVNGRDFPTVRAFLSSTTNFVRPNIGTRLPVSSILFSFTDQFFFSETDDSFNIESQGDLQLQFQVSESITGDGGSLNVNFRSTNSNGSQNTNLNFGEGSTDAPLSIFSSIQFDDASQLFFSEYTVTGELISVGGSLTGDGSTIVNEVDFSSSIEFRSILFEDGTTPESRGINLTFASGDISPNLISTVPEPSTSVLIYGISCMAALARFRRRT